MRIPILAAVALAVMLAAACGGDNGGSEDERIASVIHRLLLAAASDDSGGLESFPGGLPDDLPVEPPLYPGAELVVSSRQPAPVGAAGADPGAATPQPLLFFIVLDTGDSRDDVFSYYEEELDRDPWQIESAFSTPELDTLQFVDIDDLDISGAISIAAGGADGRTSILVSLQDAGALLEDEPPFEPGDSRPVPKEFPPDVPLYEDAIVTSSAFVREAGNQRFLLIFLTLDNQDDVIAFYREQFEDQGWTVTDGEPIALETRVTFTDAAGDIDGSVQADRFTRDRDYTEVRIQISLDPSREPAGGG